MVSPCFDPPSTGFEAEKHLPGFPGPKDMLAAHGLGWYEVTVCTGQVLRALQLRCAPVALAAAWLFAVPTSDWPSSRRSYTFVITRFIVHTALPWPASAYPLPMQGGTTVPHKLGPPCRAIVAGIRHMSELIFSSPLHKLVHQLLLSTSLTAVACRSCLPTLVKVLGYA